MGLSSAFFSPSEGWFTFPNMLVDAGLDPAGTLGLPNIPVEWLVTAVVKLENIVLSGLFLSALSASVVLAAPKMEGA